MVDGAWVDRRDYRGKLRRVKFEGLAGRGRLNPRPTLLCLYLASGSCAQASEMMLLTSSGKRSLRGGLHKGRGPWCWFQPALHQDSPLPFSTLISPPSTPHLRVVICCRPTLG